MKGALVAALPDNGFDCAPVSLSALVAWNGTRARTRHGDLVDALVTRWDGERCTWVDAGEGATDVGPDREHSKRCCRCS